MRVSYKSRVEAAVDQASQWGGIGGGHHKEWLIDQMLRALLAEKYEAWVAEWEAPQPYRGDCFVGCPEGRCRCETEGSEWSVGIPP